VSPDRIAALDTNLLLLWLVIETDQALLRTYKRVSTFEESDARLLASELQPFETVVTTPHVLAETTNLLDHAPLYRRSALFDTLRRFIDGHQEWYEEARTLCRLESFMNLGLADTALLSVSRRATVITVDWRLAGKIELQGGRVVNFNHLRNLMR